LWIVRGRSTGPLAGLAQVQESRGSCGEAVGRGGVAVKRPMMIDAIAKRKAAAKVKAINFSIRCPPDRRQLLVHKF